MSLRVVTLPALAACAGLSLGCGPSTSSESCLEWDTTVREVVANVDATLPSDVKSRSFEEDYAFVAKDLGLAAQLAACAEDGHLAAADPEPETAAPGADVAFIDQLEFGAELKKVGRALKAVSWKCNKAAAPNEAGDQVQACSGTYAKGPARLTLRFRKGRLNQAGVELLDVPTRVQDIVEKTDADVFGARKALIEKVVADLETRFGSLIKTKDGVEDGGIRMEWAGSERSRQVRLEFAQRGPSLDFWMQDAAVAREIQEAIAKAPGKKAESYFE